MVPLPTFVFAGWLCHNSEEVRGSSPKKKHSCPQRAMLQLQKRRGSSKLAPQKAGNPFSADGRSCTVVSVDPVTRGRRTAGAWFHIPPWRVPASSYDHGGLRRSSATSCACRAWWWGLSSLYLRRTPSVYRNYTILKIVRTIAVVLSALCSILCDAASCRAQTRR